MSEKPDETTRGAEEVDAQGGGSQMDSKHTKEGYDQAETSHGEDDQILPPKDAKGIVSMSEKPDETTRGAEEVDTQGGGSQMDSKHTKEGYDQVETSHGEDDQILPPKDAITPTLTAFEDIKDEEFDSTTYMKCGNVGKAVIVSNFMDGYTPIRGLNVRSYAKNDCDLLEKTLKHLGFQPFDDKENRMVYKNLTKTEFEALYNRVAKETDYRPKGKEGYTCVLFIVMSYGRSGLIQCHAEPGEYGDPPFVEQKHIQEAFQPQNNPSLALKPKLFIIQTIPKGTDINDGNEPSDVEKKETKRIPREADFLTYTSDVYCINSDHGNCFIKAIVDVLKDQKESAMEIQRVLIRMNKKYKDYSNSEKKIPCVTSSLTKQLFLV
ncbi:caspase-7-like isoform X2 [Mytilus californianus]|uniref:caspase-7-like isoform X2 n=1 Tax=Mytilus californianus TaxID=6549 RepID=UPI002245E026|nr:caspase-7-like isoform X2 [Mytilus californianus]